jgi:hypothetical protein
MQRLLRIGHILNSIEQVFQSAWRGPRVFVERHNYMADARKILACLFLSASAVAQVPAAKPADPFLDGFMHPPQSARPRIWWHWMNGNISKEGIRSDLEWMNRIGLGGVQVFDAALSTPLIVDHRVEYMTPEWKDDFRYATTLCDQFGLEMAIAGSPGWSETGGPWVTGREAMKKYVWSETIVEGGKPFAGILPHPPTVTGRYQNTGIANPAIVEPQYYADAAVIAYRTPKDEVELPAPEITTSDGPVAEAASLRDEDLTTFVAIRKSESSDGVWVAVKYPQAVTIRSLTVSVGENEHGAPINAQVQASDDGVHYRTITTAVFDEAVVETISLPAMKGQSFRLVFDQHGPSSENLHVNELALHSAGRVNRFEDKAGFRPVLDLYGFATKEADGSSEVSKQDVIDLTSRLRPDGTLQWSTPPGRWTVLRIGYSLLGTTNHPATKEATGLEVDKLDRRYVKDYMDGYLDSYRDTVGDAMMGRRGIRYVITDSWEAGTQNWTDNLLVQFRQHRGYDPMPWLPVLAGHIVESAEASDQFLWDFRKTIADLTAEEHYGQVQASLMSRHMGHYGESHESGRAFIGDGMEVKKLDDIPMGAMWTQSLGVNEPIYRFNADDRESASVAHIYGQNLAAAESMTAKYDPFGWSPATLKPTADQEFLNGINRIVIHESSHQPLKDWKPGLTLGKYGQWFNRNETWAEQSGPWIDYLARNSYMLQQGHFVADILYFYGEDSNLTAIFRDSAPNLPAGYGFDYINADGLVHMLHAADGKITTDSGMHYRLLVLDPYSRHMSLPVLRAIYALVRAGAMVAGPRPTDTPSLADDAAEFKRLSDELFGDGTGVHTVGQGRVFAGFEAVAALHALNLNPDFDSASIRSGQRVEFVHRSSPDAEIYFIDNRSDHEVAFDAAFRVTGKVPEIWRSEQGTTESLSYQITDGHTSVPLHLEAWGSAFVVFRQRATVNTFTAPAKSMTTLAAVEGPWIVNFQANRGAPEEITLPELISWPASTAPGVKFYSGTGTYRKTINASAEWFIPGSRIWLDLGDVKNLASISVNGKPMGIVWHAPFRVDVTSALQPGNNVVAIEVTNAWVNRLIGDQQQGATQYTHTDVKPYQADSPLLPSGLLGPVQFIRER